MAAPYTIQYGSRYKHADGPVSYLSDAITICHSFRRAKPSKDFPPRIIGNNVDEDCADGLSQDEREIISEAGL